MKNDVWCAPRSNDARDILKISGNLCMQEKKGEEFG